MSEDNQRIMAFMDCVVSALKSISAMPRTVPEAAYHPALQALGIHLIAGCARAHARAPVPSITLGDDAAVGDNLGGGHVTRLVGGEKERGKGHVPGIPHAPHGDALAALGD